MKKPTSFYLVLLVIGIVFVGMVVRKCNMHPEDPYYGKDQERIKQTHKIK